MPQGFFSSMPNRVMGTLVLVALFIALSAFASLTFKQSNQLSNANPATISVTGTGDSTAKPDIAQFSFSVHAEGADAKTAQDQSATSINAIMKYLKDQGIDDKDIKTENYSLSPKYKYIQKPCVFGAVCPPGEQTADGFEVSQSISVKVRKIDTAGAMLSQVGTLGATDISGLNFIVDNEDAVKAQARDLAIADAKAKAEKLAASLGVHLVRIMSFNENSGGGYPVFAAAPMADMAGAKSAVAPSIPTGENKTTSNVTITYEIK
jgi:hypothetical protein